MTNLELSIMTNSANLTDLHNAKLRQAASDIFAAYAAIDTSTGALAYAMYQAQQVFSGLDKSDTIDGYANFAQFAEKRIGVKRAQAFNLARAGSYMRVVRVQNGKSVRKVFMDKWTYAVGKFKDDGTIYESVPESFANTTLLLFSRYVSDKKPEKVVEKETRLYDLITSGKINSSMTVSAIDKVLNPVIETTAQDVTDKIAPAEGETAPAEGETAPAEGETAPAEGEFLEFRLGKEWVEKTLIPELLHFMDDSAAITELVTKLRYQAKSAK